MTLSVLLTDSECPEIAAVAERLPECRIEVCPTSQLLAAIDSLPRLLALIVTTADPVELRLLAEEARSHRIPIIVACSDEIARRRAVELGVDEWYLSPASVDEIEWRVRSALHRVRATSVTNADRVDRVMYEGMLHDSTTGMPTLPIMIERTRSLFKERGELVVFYLNFVRYARIEEIYGWEKLDAVLDTTARAVREFLDRNSLTDTRMMVEFTNDDDFIFFRTPAWGEPGATDGEITEVARRAQRFVAARLEKDHGEHIASLFDIYVGSAHIYYDPKIRVERLIYRGVREASRTARSTEQRQHARRVADLRRLLRDGSVYIEYHPIFAADTGLVFGYEALARGAPRSLRSPEVMFDVAADADLVWELSRLCRSRAVEGVAGRLEGHELLFLNADPHDFADPSFDDLQVADPSRVVIEITERTAITNYPVFRERLNALRERGFRFAVDDAGSGYAGLGSIANLEPDFIKLDISLINSIDTNFIKQNLVETMVGFAREQGAMVIAEGIENAEELETVKRLGVPLVQGFFLQPPSRRYENENAESRLAAMGAARLRIQDAGSGEARGQ